MNFYTGELARRGEPHTYVAGVEYDGMIHMRYIHVNENEGSARLVQRVAKAWAEIARQVEHWDTLSDEEKQRRREQRWWEDE